MPDNYCIDVKKRFTENKDEYALKYKKFIEKYQKSFDDKHYYCEIFSVENPYEYLIDCPCGLKYNINHYKNHLKCKRHMILLSVLGILNENDLEYLKKNDII
jgi:hypothetical protein